MEMTIDGWDISEVGAELRRFVDHHHEIIPNSEWDTGSQRPVFLPSDIGWKTISVDIMVRGDGYDDIVRKRGLILSKLLKVVSMKFKGHDHTYDLVLKATPKPDEKLKDSWHILPLEFIGIEYGDEIVINASNSNEFEIDNIGTYQTPVTLLITPTTYTVIGEKTSEDTALLIDEDGSAIIDPDDEAYLVSYTQMYGGMKISGISTDPITGEPADILIKNFSIGSTIEINGNTGIISEDGESKIEDVDIWSLPSIHPGTNVIKTNGSFMNIVVKYRPRYM